jgi:uncharacterized membrane protein
LATFSYDIEIGATPEQVWAVWMDVERWPEWAPPMKKVEKQSAGDLKAGSRVKIDADGAPPATWEVTDLRPHEYFEWATSVRGVNVTAGHRAVRDDAKTRVTLNVEYSGLISVLFRPLIMRTARKNVTAEAHGLRARCETASEE